MQHTKKSPANKRPAAQKIVLQHKKQPATQKVLHKKRKTATQIENQGLEGPTKGMQTLSQKKQIRFALYIIIVTRTYQINSA